MSNANAKLYEPPPCSVWATGRVLERKAESGEGWKVMMENLYMVDPKTLGASLRAGWALQGWVLEAQWRGRGLRAVPLEAPPEVLEWSGRRAR